MDFGFSEEQVQLRETVREYLADKAPVSFAREMGEQSGAMTDAVWREISEMGWLGLAVPERFGGIGLGWLDLAVVLEAMGAVVFPGPFFSTSGLALPALIAAGTDDQLNEILPGIAEGSTRATLAAAESGGGWAAADIAMTAERSDGGYRLSGTKLFVPDGAGAGLLVVAARLDAGDGVGLFVVPADTAGVAAREMSTIDRTRRFAEVQFDGVQLGADALLGGRALDAHEYDRVIQLSKTLLSAEMAGAADRALGMSVEYVQIREQFGRTIATFQSLQHKLADMKVGVENVRSLVYYAAWSFDDAGEDSALPSAMAKAYAGDTCRDVVATAIQVHGGIGFTWEHDLQLYFKRIQADAVLFGDPAESRAAVADLIGL